MASDLVLFEGEHYDMGFERVHSVNILHSKKELFSAKGVVIAECNEKTIKQVIETNRADIVLLAEESLRDRIRQKVTALTPEVCVLAKKKDIAVAFSFSHLLNSHNRAMAIGRMRQNIMLCRKYSLPMIFASFARNKFEMRGMHDLKSLMVLIGFTQGEAKRAFEIYDELLNKKKQTITKGVRIINADD